MPIKSNKITPTLRNRPQLDLPMPNPSNEEIESLQFNAIWDVIKTLDINVPEFYSGYCGGNGSHVKLILDSLKQAIREEKLNDLDIDG